MFPAKDVYDSAECVTVQVYVTMQVYVTVQACFQALTWLWAMCSGPVRLGYGLDGADHYWGGGVIFS